MGTPAHWIRFLAVATAYGVAFFLFRRAMPFSLPSPWFVFVAMVCFLGLAFVARTLARIRMPRSLRRIRRWEAEGGVYRMLGVPAFGALVRRTPLRVLNRDVYLSVGTQDASTLNAHLEAAEASHFWDAALVVPYMIYCSVQGMWTTFLWFLLAQVLINAYPITHLRLTRYRLQRLASRTPTHRQRIGRPRTP
jgi:hypothetical protein